ncbi:hypothetical protein [Gloeobacter kilaueensis]|nr:hypothetical protein [Gloeobacter kilaueensis]
MVIGLMDQYGHCYASAATIAQYADCSHSTFWRQWPDIEFAGLLTMQKRTAGPSFIYLGVALIDRMQGVVRDIRLDNQP